MFITKLGILLAVLCNYTAALSNDDIVPQAKRATCIGQCQLVARAITVLASEVAELPKPKPMAWFVRRVDQSGFSLWSLAAQLSIHRQASPLGHLGRIASSTRIKQLNGRFRGQILVEIVIQLHHWRVTTCTKALHLAQCE